MKKILSLAMAGIAVLALAGCGLHDADNFDLSGGGIPGAMNGWSNTTAFTSVDKATNTYTYEFQAGADTYEWKVITTLGDWNSGAFGGDDAVLEVAADGKAVDLVYDNKTGGKSNCKTTGLTIGNTYKIVIEVTGVNATATINCTKEVPAFNLLIKNTSGPDGVAAMTPIDGGYKYTLKAEKDGEINFVVSGGNMLYYSADATLELGEGETATAEYSKPSDYIKFTYKKGEYLIVVDTSKGYDEITITAKYAALLKGALWAINGPMGIKKVTDDDGDGTYTVEFKAEAGGWGAGTSDMCFTLYAQKTEEALIGDNWWSGTAYRFGEFDVKLGEKTTCKKTTDKNITLKSITDGATYVAEFTSDADNVYVTVTLKE